MPRPRLFCANLVEGSIVLSKEESHHALDVRRVQVGDEVCLFDGSGREGVGVVAEAGRHLLRVAVRDVFQRPFELSRKMTLAVAMPKGQRAGYLVEKCTELGVAAIWPLLAERSVARPGSDSHRKWCRRAVEAAKQSQRAWVPTIAPPQSFCDSVARVGEFDGACLADTTKPATSLRAFLATPSTSVLVWIGPEGGWTSTERAQAMEAGAVPVRLGPTILRAETAAIAACAAVAILDHE